MSRVPGSVRETVARRIFVEGSFVDCAYSGMALRAFETLQGLKRASSLAELDRVAGRRFEELGFHAFAAARFYSADGAATSSLLFGNLGTWGHRYLERGYAARSSIAREMLAGTRPYAWSDVAKSRPLDAPTEQILDEAREFGFTDGLYVPWRDPDGSVLAVALCGKRTDLSDPWLRTVGEVLGSFYGAEGNRLKSRALKRPSLSRRQRECLLWVRHGKSSADIGGILGLSIPTVDGHIAEACRKLGVRTRVQAVVEACLAGLLDR